MSASCIGEPVSYLRLERYELGEVGGGERAQIEQHLLACAVCRHCLDELRSSPVSLKPLTLPAGAPRSEPARPKVSSAAPRKQAFRLSFAFALATAAALLLVLLPARRPHEGLPPSQRMLKGGTLALELVRERDGVLALDSRRFRSGDRYEARVTCPHQGSVHAQLVVLQAGEAFFPLAEATLRCGNAVPLPGAFVLTGQSDASVCVVIDPERRTPRERLLTRATIASLGDRAVCTTLRALH